MKRRLTYILAAAAVALGFAVALGNESPAIAVQISEPPDTIPPGIVAPDSARGFGPMTEKSVVVPGLAVGKEIDTAWEAVIAGASGEIEVVIGPTSHIPDANKVLVSSQAQAPRWSGGPCCGRASRFLLCCMEPYYHRSSFFLPRAFAVIYTPSLNALIGAA